MLQRALAMSMDGGAPDLAAMTEEEQIAYAMRMSMADSQADAVQVNNLNPSFCFCLFLSYKSLWRRILYLRSKCRAIRINKTLYNCTVPLSYNFTFLLLSNLFSIICVFELGLLWPACIF